jgi:hypothetical protein
LGLANVDQGKLDGPALGMERYGGGIVYVWQQSGEMRALELRYESSGRTRPVDHGGFALGDLAHPRLLRIGSLRDGPLLVVAHDRGLALAAVEPRGRGRVDRIETVGYVAATEPFPTGRDGRLALFAAAPGRLAHIAQAGGGFALVAEHPIAAEKVAYLHAFAPQAIAGDGTALWVGGAAADRALLLRFDARELAARTAAAPVEPTAVLDLGRGTIDHVRLFERGHQGSADVAVAGTKDGRAWVGICETHGRAPTLAHDRFLSGTAVDALGVNPGRAGWSLAAATADGTVHLLRLPGDPALPRDWDPFAPAPVPAPVPPPVEETPAAEDPLEALPPAEAGGHAVPYAVLPRAEATRGGEVDTEIVLVNLAREPAQVVLRFVDDDGRGGFARVTVEAGKRRKVSVAEALFRRRFGRRVMEDFDGYVRVDGAPKDTLVVDALIRRAGQPPEEVRPHWR